MTTENLTIIVNEQGSNVVFRNIAAIGDAASSAAKPLSKVDDYVKMIKNSASGLGELFAFGFLVNGVKEAADAYTLMENKLRSVGVAEQNLLYTTNKLVDAAIETRTSIESVSTTFQRLDVATSDLKITQMQVLEMTTTLSKSIQMSGASASAAKAGLYQLAEGMEANRLQGVHLKALITDLPMLAKQIATALGTNIDGLRQMGHEGTLSAEKITNALLAIKPVVDAAFERTVPTVANSFTNLYTRIIQFVGQENSAIGASRILSEVLTEVSLHLDLIATILLVVGAGYALAFSATIVSSIYAVVTASYALVASTLAFEVTLASLEAMLAPLFALIAANPFGALLTVLAAAAIAISLFGDKVEVTRVRMDAVSAIGTQSTGLSNFALGAKNASERMNNLNDGIAQIPTASIDTAATQMIAFGDTTLKSAYISVTLKDYMLGTFDLIMSGLKLMGNGFVNIWQVITGAAVTDTSVMTTSIISLLDEVSDKLINMKSDVAKAGAAIAYGMDTLLHPFQSIEDSGRKLDALSDTMDEINKKQVESHNAVTKAATERALAEKKALDQISAFGSTDPSRGLHPPKAEPEALDKGAQRQLDNAIKQNVQLKEQYANMFKIKEVRTDLAALAKIEADIAIAKDPSVVKELQLNLALTKSIQERQVYQKGFDEVVKGSSLQLQKEYTNAMEGARIALNGDIATKQKGVITQADYDKQITNLTESYKRANNVLYDYEKGLQDQHDLFGLTGEAAKGAAAAQELHNLGLSKGIDFNLDYNKTEYDRLLALQKTTDHEKKVTQELTSIYEEYGAALAKVKIRQEALDMARNSGKLSQGNFDIESIKNAVSGANSRIDSNSGTTSFSDMGMSALGKMSDSYKGIARGMTDAFSSAFESIGKGFADTAAKAIVTGGATKATWLSIATSMETNLLSTLIQVGEQYLVNALLKRTINKGEGIAYSADVAAQAQAQVSLAALNAFASTAAIPVVGPAAAPAAAGVAAGIAQAFASAAITSAGLTGMLHDGIDNVPREGTWLLDRGERVVDSRTNADLKSYLSRAAQPEANKQSMEVHLHNWGTKEAMDDYMASAPAGQHIINHVVKGAETVKVAIQ